MPQYKKVFDVGTYAGVSGYTRVGIPTLRTPGSGGKQVAKSLRFRSANTAYLNRTAGTAGSRTTWTWSGWVKRGDITTAVQMIFNGYSTASSSMNLYFANQSLQLGDASGSTGVQSTAIFKDPSSWYHIVAVLNTTSATPANRMVLYVNGVQITALAQALYPALNATYDVNASGVAHNMFRQASTGLYPCDGYMADINFIDGSALDPTSFGEYNSDNIWVPKAYSGSYSGTNSFYLDFNDTSSVAALGYDAAGSNDWTVNGISLTAGTTYDSMYDSPTDYDNSVYGAGNYATLNAAQTTPSGSFSEANLKFTTASAWGGSKATIAIPATGKWYAEFTLGSTSSNSAQGDVGVFPTTLTNDYDWTGAYGLEVNNGFFFLTNGSYSSNRGGTTAGGTVFQVAVDADAGKVWFGVSNAWYDTYNTTNGNPSSGTNPSGSSINFAAVQYAMGIKTAGNNWTANFGQRTFAYTPPTGFKALNTKNITRPTDANMWFYGDTPDLMWIKNRTASSTDHSLTDTVRGVGLGLSSSSTAAEQGAQDVAEMNKFGMTLIGASSRTTAASNNFVYWAWKGGGTGVSNTSGSITSTVSANTTAGFSVVTWTADGSLNNQVGHGLNVAPVLVIYKDRDAVSDWWTLYTFTGSYQYIRLNLTAAGAAQSGVTISSTTIPNYNFTSTRKMVAYCFAPVAGYSAFGSYTGNGSASGDGPFVYTNFRPRWLMIKLTTAPNENWQIIDTYRGLYNPTLNQLYADLTLQEASGTNRAVDVLSNGFKIRGDNAGINTLNQTYIYAAFAEHPFKISRAR